MIWIKAAPVPNTTFQCGRQVSGFNRRPPLGYQCIVIIRSPPIIPTRPPTHSTITLLPPHTPQTRLKAWKFGRKMLRGLKRWMPACLIRNSGQRVPCRVAPKITFLSLLISSSLYLHHLFILAHMSINQSQRHCCHGCSFLDHHARLPIHQVCKITQIP